MSTAIQTCVSEGKVWMECQLLPKLVYQKARFGWNVNCYPNLCIRRQGLDGMSTAIQTCVSEGKGLDGMSTAIQTCVGSS